LFDLNTSKISSLYFSPIVFQCFSSFMPGGCNFSTDEVSEIIFNV
jgi:hypothetical protein